MAMLADAVSGKRGGRVGGIWNPSGRLGAGGGPTVSLIWENQPMATVHGNWAVILPVVNPPSTCVDVISPTLSPTTRLGKYSLR